MYEDSVIFVNRFRFHGMAAQYVIEATGDKYCKYCDMWLSGQDAYEDHKLGKKHKKNVLAQSSNRQDYVLQLDYHIISPSIVDITGTNLAGGVIGPVRLSPGDPIRTLRNMLAGVSECEVVQLKLIPPKSTFALNSSHDRKPVSLLAPMQDGQAPLLSCGHRRNALCPTCWTCQAYSPAAATPIVVRYMLCRCVGQQLRMVT